MPALPAFDVAWSPKDTLLAHIGSVELDFSKNVGNQLIWCARMNTWDRFMAMLEIKIPGDKLGEIKSVLADLDSKALWKVKEAFARLSTLES